MQITVLGAGLVGNAIARDLAQEPGFSVTAVDRDAAALDRLDGKGLADLVQADLGAKGTYYRAMVGPFTNPAEAAELCSSLKAAGGQCLIQKN